MKGASSPLWSGCPFADSMVKPQVPFTLRSAAGTSLLRKALESLTWNGSRWHFGASVAVRDLGRVISPTTCPLEQQSQVRGRLFNQNKAPHSPRARWRQILGEKPLRASEASKSCFRRQQCFVVKEPLDFTVFFKKKNAWIVPTHQGKCWMNLRRLCHKMH